MATVIHPDKDAVRHWLADRRIAGTPPPAPADIRRELGWSMLAPSDPRNTTR